MVLFGIVALLYMQDVSGGWWRPFLATAFGVALAIAIDRLTEFFTGTHSPPVKEIKKSADTGPATLILSGISVGFEIISLVDPDHRADLISVYPALLRG